MKKFTQVALSTLALAMAVSSHARDELVVYSLPNLSSPFEVQLSKYAVETGDKLGIKLQILDGQSSSSKQVSDLESSIARGAQAILIQPNDVNALATAVENIVSEKIPAATIDRAVISSDNVPHFGANNSKGGKNIAEFVVKQFPNGADIVFITGQPGSSSNIERTRSMRKVFKEAGSNYKLVVDQTGMWLRSEGLRIVESIVPTLDKKPDVIVSVNDAMALGAIEALKGLGYKAGEIKVTGFDANAEALERIKDGWLMVTADQRPEYAVSSAIEQLVDNIRNKKPVTGLDFEPKLITKDNVNNSNTK